MFLIIALLDLYSYNEIYIFVNLHLAHCHMSDNKQRACTKQFWLLTYHFESGSTVIRMVLSHLAVTRKYRQSICFSAHNVFLWTLYFKLTIELKTTGIKPAFCRPWWMESWKKFDFPVSFVIQLTEIITRVTAVETQQRLWFLDRWAQMKSIPTLIQRVCVCVHFQIISLNLKIGLQPTKNNWIIRNKWKNFKETLGSFH